jgi:hypothetical protein
MAGYSGTPLSKKLGIRPGARVYLVHPPPHVLSELRGVLDECRIVRADRGPWEFAILFARTRSQLVKEFARAEGGLEPSGMVWACWPKKSSGVTSDLDDERVREVGLGIGLVDVKVCAVNEI